MFLPRMTVNMGHYWGCLGLVWLDVSCDYVWMETQQMSSQNRDLFDFPFVGQKNSYKSVRFTTKKQIKNIMFRTKLRKFNQTLKIMSRFFHEVRLCTQSNIFQWFQWSTKDFGYQNSLNVSKSIFRWQTKLYCLFALFTFFLHP
jgi:hypothetical protein